MPLGRALAVLLALVAWLALAPSSVGGGTTYLVTSGVSMEPRISTGDLVLVRARPRYQVGDVVAYRSQEIDTVVLHRIVATEDDRFVTRGDNNSWLDPDRPTADDLIGAEWVHARGGGRVLRLATQPAALGVLAFGLVAGGSAAASRTRRRRGRGTEAVPGTTSAAPPARPGQALHPHLQTAGTVLAAVGLTGAALGGVAWTRDSHVLASAPSSATERMVFSYTATVPESPAYDDTTVVAPEPVFRRLAHTVEVGFSYTGSGSSDRTLSVAAELSTPSGWRSTLPLTRPEALPEARYEGRVVLDLDALDARATAAAEATGIPADDVSVAVVPTVTTAAGAVFAPRLELHLTPLQLRLAGQDPAALTVEDSFSVAGQTREPATLSLLGRELGVLAARITSILLLLVAVVGGLEVRERARRAAARPEPERIRARHGALLVDVAPIHVGDRRVVDVPDFAALARVAERYGLLVLTWAERHRTTYVVQDDDTVYQYRTTPQPAGPDESEDPAGPEAEPEAAGPLRPADLPAPREGGRSAGAHTVLPGR